MSASASAVLASRSASNGKPSFYPRAPSSFEEAGLNAAIVEGLVFKFLVNCGMARAGGSRPSSACRFDRFPSSCASSRTSSSSPTPIHHRPMTMFIR